MAACSSVLVVLLHPSRWHAISKLMRLRSFTSDQLIVPSYNLATVGRRALQVSADNLWNSLPAHLTSATSLTVFRQRLKTFLFRCSYPDLIIWQSELIFCCGPNNNFVIQATLKCHWWWWWQELEKFGRIGLREKDGKEYQRERTARRRERWRRCR